MDPDYGRENRVRFRDVIDRIAFAVQEEGDDGLHKIKRLFIERESRAKPATVNSLPSQKRISCGQFVNDGKHVNCSITPEPRSRSAHACGTAQRQTKS